jgi:hypothetical protein
MAMPPYTPDIAVLNASGVRIVPAVGADPVVFPGDHDGFTADKWTPGNDPAVFAGSCVK